MTQYALHNEAWEVQGFIESDDPPEMEGLTAVALAAPMTPLRHPHAPSPSCVLLVDELGELAWLETASLDDLKARKIAEINVAKYQADQTSFTFQGHEIQADPHSMLQIQCTNGVVLLIGAVPQAAQQWKTLANEYVALPDVTTWRLFYLAMVSRGSENFNRAQTLKQAVATATSVEDLAAIQW